MTKGAVSPISIHAPTWGATCLGRQFRHAFADFNPRTHVGCDLLSSTPIRHINNFNPRTHVGCNLLSRILLGVILLFQSTHPRGVRPSSARVKNIVSISIHAPTWGATPLRIITTSTVQFQSTHPRGVRPSRAEASPRRGISIHAPTWGATLQ